MSRTHRKTAALTVIAMMAGVGGIAAAAPGGGHKPSGAGPRTATPIKHLVVIYQENVSFDHYFGTYPHAANPRGEPSFVAAAGTPTVNGLTHDLLTDNPNSANPKRLSRSEALVCDQGHGYKQEQQAFDHGLMDKFVEFTQRESCDPPDKSKPGLVMDYYDGNTVTGLWNYAKRYAMSDNFYGTGFGPSTPGALNLVSGQTHGATTDGSTPAPDEKGEVANQTVIGDPDPTFDDCSGDGTTVAMTGRNIGDLLNAKGVSWGWFQGGFRPTGQTAGKAVCGASHKNIGGADVKDYSPHHEPFEYYKSTTNVHHVAPASVAEIGHAGRANHQYDLADFTTALDRGRLPAVSFVKAAKYQDGHAGYSDPLDEQQFVVKTINALQRSKDWSSTAVVIAYDDSDGWYDHQMSPIVNHSTDGANDALSAAGYCGSGRPVLGGFQDRCGYGPRVPLLVVSPYSAVNTVDHSITDQTSILRFVEDNWGTGRIGGGSFDAKAGSLDGMLDFGRGKRAKRMFLDPQTGRPTTAKGRSGRHKGSRSSRGSGR